MRVRVRIRVHVTGGVLARGLACVGRLSEQPHWRWPKQGAAVAKQRGLGQLSGLCKVYRPKRRPAEGAVLFRPIMWLYSAPIVLGSTLHLALAIFQQGIPCFGHHPNQNIGWGSTMPSTFRPITHETKKTRKRLFNVQTELTVPPVSTQLHHRSEFPLFPQLLTTTSTVTAVGWLLSGVLPAS